MTRRLLTALALGLALAVGAATAAGAVWSVQQSASSTATTASIGITHSLGSGSTLAHTYSSTALVAVGTVTLTNTSSRAGTATLSVTASSASSTLRSAVAVELGTAASCTTTASLAGSQTGTLAATTSYATTLAAGASATVCVRTSMTGAGVTANAGASASVSLGSSIQLSTWSAQATPIGVTQSVAAASGVTIDPSAWYWIWTTVDPALCLENRWFGADPARLWAESCADLGSSTPANELWQFIPTDSGFYRIVPQNDAADGWRVGSAGNGQAVQTTGGTNNFAQWQPVDAGNGTVRFALRQNTNRCMELDTPATPNQSLVSIRNCDATKAAQHFVLDMFEVVTPPAAPLSCSADGWNAYYSWPQLTGYQGQVVYRVLVNGTVSTLHTRGTGWDTTIQYAWQSFTAAHPAGSYSIEVQQSVNGGAWTTTGTGTLVRGASTPWLVCG